MDASAKTERPTTVSISAADTLAHVAALCAVGDRFAGQIGDAPSAAYVEQCFSDIGLNIERFTVQVPTFREDVCEVTLGDGTPLDAMCPYFGVATEGTLEAPLVYVGGGLDADYEEVDVAGKVVILEEMSFGLSMFWLGGYAARARDRGAVGVLVVHPFPWPYRMTMEVGRENLAERFDDPRIPAVAVSGVSGMRLMHFLGQGEAEIRLRIEVADGMVSSDHVAGVKLGSSATDERVIVLAHRDNGAPPGANDNASGTAAVLEIARAITPIPTERSVVFLSAAAEEGAAPGVAQYVDSLGDARRNIAAAISMDMIGVGGPLRLVDNAYWPDLDHPLQHDPWLREVIEGVAAELGYHIGRLDADWGAADAGRFLHAGVPAAWFWKPDDFRYHSPLDTPENVDGNAIRAVAEITAETVLKVARRAPA